MSYHGPADVTLSARFFGQPDEFVENPGMDVHLRGVRPGVTELTVLQRLSTPMRANWVTVTLPNGLTLGGEIIQTAAVATGVGGVITFNAHVRDLGV